jgi:hypothetical protein
MQCLRVRFLRVRRVLAKNIFFTAMPDYFRVFSPKLFYLEIDFSLKFKHLAVLPRKFSKL